MRLFFLYRVTDVSGVSGTGIVAEGVRFSNGKVAITWHGKYTSVTLYDNIATAMNVHCHGGASKMYWLGDVARPFNPWTHDETLITQQEADSLS